MHSKSIARVLLLTALAALVLGAGQVRAQAEPQVYGEDYSPPDPVWPFPIGSSHPEDGGLFTSASFVSYRQTNPLHSQLVAERGFDFVQTPFTIPTLFGSRTPALDVTQVSGPTDFEPGFAAEVGWKFGDGSAFSVRWMFINEVNHGAAATFAAPNFQVGRDLSDSFLFAPVYNFPNDYVGPANKLATDTGNASAAPGIWNGASIMTEQFLQRTQQWDFIYRVPMYETENYRISGVVGPRLTWIWERYKWTTTDLDVNGSSSPNFVAQYTNVTSNRMYGVHIGCEQECYLGHGFAADVQLQMTVYEDSVKEEIKYSLARGANGEDHPGPVSKRGRNQWTFVPAPQATFSLSWFPIEAVEFRAGYDLQAFFNTVSMHQPIDFNYGTVDPRYETNTVRLLDGLDIGIGIHF